MRTITETERRDAELVCAKIIAAFERTGVQVGTGDYFEHNAGEVYAACAVGALALDAGIPDEPMMAVCARRGGWRAGADCVVAGWDDAFDGNVHTFGDTKCKCGRERCGYYEAGATAAVAMGA